MRDVKRIRLFLESVAEVWETHPDLRFGQLVCNVITNETMRFYMEDDEMLEAFQAFAKKVEGESLLMKYRDKP